MRISVLDTAPIVRGSTAGKALRNSVDLAVLADALGYHRYWVAEHHGMRGVASAAPAVLACRLADATGRIRVGAGGVLLPHHPPIVVAEQFGTLTALHPGRIDLGVGRALGGPRAAADAVRGGRERTATSFRQQLEELIGYFEQRPRDAVRAVPAIGNEPPIWLLGSSTASARLAGSLGLAYAFAHHLNPGEAAAATRVYRDSFQSDGVRLTAPSTVVSVAVIVADGDERADWLAGPTRLKTLSRAHGLRMLLPSPLDAAAYPYSAADHAEIAACSDRLHVGSPRTVRASLRGVLDETGADELMVTTPVFDHADRRRSYELLREVARDLRPAR